MRKLSASTALLAACCGCAVATAQTVEFRIVEREGQTMISSSADAELNMAVQARIAGGAPGTALSSFAFDVVIHGEPDAFGTLNKGLITNLDGTYASAIDINANLGRGGLARQYTFLAGIADEFNGLINTTLGTFTNSPEQEIGLITAFSEGSSLLGTPGLDMNGDGVPDTYPGSGNTAPLDPTIGATYFGVGGGWIDVYRFRYTATNLSTRTLQFDLRNTAASTFTSLIITNVSWGTIGTNRTSSTTPTLVPIAVSDTGACCDAASACTSTTGAACTGLFLVGSTCAPNPCPPLGSCCFATGGCSVATQIQCGAAWTQSGVCSPNICPQVACCTSVGACSLAVDGVCGTGSARAGNFTCSPNPCPQIACCTSVGACSLTTDGVCGSGSPLAGHSTCLPNPCPNVACCTSLGACSVSADGACGNGGTLGAPGSTCSPNTCPQVACCTSVGACILATNGSCGAATAFIGGFSCSPNVCTQPGACCGNDCQVLPPFMCTMGRVWMQGACSPSPCAPATTCCNASTGACSVVFVTGNTVYNYSYTLGSGGVYGVNSSGGRVESINASFSPNTNQLVFDAYFSGATTGGPLITTGFWLVLDYGPDPKAHPGELAIFYFDAATLASPALTVYGYNGADAGTSWRDGDPATTGDQPGDLIKGINETGYIHALLAEDTTVAGQPRRHFMLDIDATDIIAHAPLYPAASPWYGAGFDRVLGLWFHSAGGFAATYESGGRGGVTSLSITDEGWLDGSNHLNTSHNDPCTFGSRITLGAACTPSDTCPQSRACCNVSGMCIAVPAAQDCPTGYTFASSGAGACSPSPCPSFALQPTGACCNTLTGACCLLPASGCSPSAENCTWNAGGACTTGRCPPAQGSCCNVVTGDCSVCAQATCGAAAHDWLACGTCSPSACAAPGICCNSAAGTCRRFTQGRCTTGCTWAASGVCSPNPCSLPGPCCNVVTGTCQIMLRFACPPAAHDWMPGGTCSTNLCTAPGACCNTATSVCRRLTRARCAEGSVWAAGACSPNPCALPGPCCNILTGTCQLAMQAGCGAAAHDWAPGSTCSPNLCAAIGACCDPATGACRRSTQARCTTGNIWMSPGVCSPNPCFMPQGACCNVVYAICTLTMQSECTPAGHDWFAGGTCTPDTCAGSAACCDALRGICRRLTETRCMAAEGRWLADQACMANPCGSSLIATCLADFDRSGSADVQDVFAFLTAWFAGDPRGDVSANAEIDVGDIFDFMTLWFAGC